MGVGLSESQGIVAPKLNKQTWNLKIRFDVYKLYLFIFFDIKKVLKFLSDDLFGKGQIFCWGRM